MRFWVASGLSRVCDVVLGTFESSSEAPSDLLERPTGKNSTVGLAQLGPTFYYVVLVLLLFTTCFHSCYCVSILVSLLGTF